MDAFALELVRGADALPGAGQLDQHALARDPGLFVGKGFINNGGMQGALKRDEFNQADNRDAFVQASLDLGAQWTATAGVRASRVKFRSTDHFITTGNPDDSGGVSYSATSPVLGPDLARQPRAEPVCQCRQGL